MDVESNPYEPLARTADYDLRKKPTLVASIVTGIGAPVVGLVLSLRIATAAEIDAQSACVAVGAFVGLFSCVAIKKYPRIQALLELTLAIIAGLIGIGLFTHIRMIYAGHWW